MEKDTKKVKVVDKRKAATRVIAILMVIMMLAGTVFSVISILLRG